MEKSFLFIYDNFLIKVKKLFG